jgi:uncharacterized membrane protein YqjE
MYDRAGYSSLIGRIRENVRTYLRKQIELPKQEIAEILRANLRAVKWFGIALVLVMLFLVSVVALLIAILANLLPGGDALRGLLVSTVIVTLLLLGGAGLTGWRGYKSLDIRGPEKSIESFKETVTWAKARLLGRSES